MKSPTDKRGATPGAVGERLRDVLERREWTVKDFLDRLKEDASVTGQTAIYKYVRGDGRTPPPADFLEDAARVLGVRSAWLAFDDGAMTREEEEYRIEKKAEVRRTRAKEDREVERAAFDKGWTKALSAALEDALGDQVPPVARAVVAHHWKRVQDTAPTEKGVKHTDMLHRLARAVAAPLRELDIGMTSLPRNEQADYVMGVIPAVARVAELFLRKQTGERLAERFARFEKREEK